MSDASVILPTDNTLLSSPNSVDNSRLHRVSGDLLYQPNETIFGISGPMMHARGWSVWPQERAGTRRPSRVNGELVAWSRLNVERATPEEMAAFCRDAGQANAACVLGPMSGNTFALDIDCMDEAVSLRVQEIAARTLGSTALRRIGRAPKIALIYRYGGGPPRSRQLRMEGRDDCMVEVLGAGKALTMHGLHHVTGRWFQWPDQNPLVSGPEIAPEVTAAQVDAFIAAVGQEFPFVRKQAPEIQATWAIQAGGNPDGEIVVPGRRATGKLTDGREAHLRDLAWAEVRRNGAELLSAKENGKMDVVQERVTRAVIDQFGNDCEVDGRWSTELSTMAVQRVGTAMEKLISGEMEPFAPPPPAEVMAGQYEHYLDLDAVMGAPPTPLDFVLPGVLAGTMSVLVSPGGAGKSMLSLGLASCVASGKSLWNLLPTDPQVGVAVVVSAEDPTPILEHRLHAMANTAGGGEVFGDRDFRSRLRIKALQGTRFSLGSWTSAGGFHPSRAFSALKQEMLELRPRLIVIDTLNRVLSGIPENDNGAISAVISEIEAMIAPTGAACLMLHHVSKSAALGGQSGEQQAARGAGAISDNARWQSNLFGMTREQADEYGVDDMMRNRWVLLSNPKSNYAPQQDDRWLFREAGGVLRGRELVPGAFGPKSLVDKARKRRGSDD